ncbi:hypothetical protein LCGC14_1682070 [marine sediment metagenome]|uniref:Uncharacterized protein n=1 Tax=marine sediment metagenome TaxID=412755 RepID=A0A0F9IAR3_9ZZZZ
MADKEQTLKVITRDPKKYLLVNLEDGTVFQGQDQDEEHHGGGGEVIRRRATLMWKSPDDKTLLCAINVLTDVLETGEDRGTNS